MLLFTREKIKRRKGAAKSKKWDRCEENEE
jgi:hypothetical protein